MRILVTGANGFVGSALVARLAADGTDMVLAAVRRPASNLPVGVEQITVSDLSGTTDWMHAVHAIDAVVHTAARVHVMHKTGGDPLGNFRRVNVDGTLNLARQAAAAGARRFVFISSIKVNGEHTTPNRPFTADDEPSPADAYGVSKHEAERGLAAVARETGLELVIIRPVLVYGPGVKANFASMMRWVVRNTPLPLGAIHNKRSFVAIDNLVDLIVTCLRHPAAAGQTFLVSDGEDLSTTELLRRMARVTHKSKWLIPIPAIALRAVARLIGRSNYANRLCSSLQVDIRKTQALLDWAPPVSVEQALMRTAKDFQRQA